MQNNDTINKYAQMQTNKINQSAIPSKNYKAIKL